LGDSPPTLCYKRKRGSLISLTARIIGGLKNDLYFSGLIRLAIVVRFKIKEDAQRI
jgi:hypothetical protein